MKAKKYSKEVRAQAEKLLEQGLRPIDVAAKLKVPVASVSYWKHHPKNGAAPAGHNGTADAITFLRHSRKVLNESIRSGKAKQASRSELYMLLALDALEGR